jgi:hypothetical protein
MWLSESRHTDSRARHAAQDPTPPLLRSPPPIRIHPHPQLHTHHPPSLGVECMCGQVASLAPRKHTRSLSQCLFCVCTSSNGQHEHLLQPRPERTCMPELGGLHGVDCMCTTEVVAWHHFWVHIVPVCEALGCTLVNACDGHQVQLPTRGRPWHGWQESVERIRRRTRRGDGHHKHTSHVSAPHQLMTSGTGIIKFRFMIARGGCVCVEARGLIR